MYIVRVYKDYKTGKELGAKVVDENTMQFKDVEWKALRELNKDLTECGKPIVNLDISSYGKATIKNMNPRQKVKYYKQEFVDNLDIRQYCIITGSRQGKLDFIADSDNGIYSGNNVTLGELATKLGIPSIQELKLYNAKIVKENNKYSVYLYTGNSYRKLQSVVDNIDTNPFEREWGVEIQRLTEEGYRLNFLEHIDGKGEAVIPEGISYIEKFGGGVNKIKMPISLHSLGEGCFSELSDIKSVYLGRGILEIPNRCFMDTALRDVKFSGAEVRIGDYAFNKCHDLKSVVVTTARYIGEDAFSQTSIGTVNLLNAEIIGKKAFSFNSKLHKVTLHEGLREIGAGAFKCCSALQSIEIPSSVKHIGRRAFEDCSKLRQVIISRNTELDENVFPKRVEIMYK